MPAIILPIREIVSLISEKVLPGPNVVATSPITKAIDGNNNPAKIAERVPIDNRYISFFDLYFRNLKKLTDFV